jgi:hypothetical protein
MGNVGKCNRNFERRSAHIFYISPCLSLIIEVDCALFMVRADDEEAAGVLNRNDRALSIINLTVGEIYTKIRHSYLPVYETSIVMIVNLLLRYERTSKVCYVNVEGNI